MAAATRIEPLRPLDPRDGFAVEREITKEARGPDDRLDEIRVKAERGLEFCSGPLNVAFVHRDSPQARVCFGETGIELQRAKRGSFRLGQAFRHGNQRKVPR